MLLTYIRLRITLFIFLQIWITTLFSQRCDTTFFANSYRHDNKSIKGHEFVRNQEKEFVWLGESKAIGAGSNGLVTKLSAKGSLIWTREYLIERYDELVFTRIEAGLDGNCIIAGSAYKVDPVSQIRIASAIVLLSIDKYGNVLWSKIIEANTRPTKDTYFLANIIPTTDGDFIINISAGNNDPDRKFIASSYIFRINNNGNVKWSKQLSSTEVEITYFGSYYFKALKQLPGGNILVGNLFDDFDARAVTLTKMGCHFIELDYATGEKVWDKSYKLNDGLGSHASEVKNISVLSNGDLSFFTHCYQGTGAAKYLTPVNIITDNKGILKNAIAYYRSDKNADSRIADIYDEGNGTQIILMDEGESNTALLAAIDDQGQLIWHKSFKGPDGPITNLFSALVVEGNNFYFASTSAQEKGWLYNVDTSGSLNCMASNVSMGSKSVSDLFTPDDVNIMVTDYYTGTFVNTSIVTTNFFLGSISSCKISNCCTDIMNTAGTYNICEGSSFTLPDNTIAKEAGVYYTTSLSTTGCDSISLYEISVTKNPASLRLPSDTCITPGEMISLQATVGFDKYRWMNNIVSDSSHFDIRQPGKYWVNVANRCGSKTDSIIVDASCFYPVYMPSGFTPNGDNLNDIFRVPPRSKSKLSKLTIFNRWGAKVFETNNISNGWNGEINGVPQETGTFVYHLEMLEESGKKIKQKGTITLIR